MKKTFITIAIVTGLLVGCQSPSENAQNDKSNAQRSLAAAKSSKVKEVVNKKPPLNSKDMKNISNIAKQNLENAHTSYAYFAQQMMNPERQTEENMKVLVQATIDLSNVDGSNDHYYYFAKVWEKSPDKVKKALTGLSVSKKTEEEVLLTVQSFLKSIKHGNG